MGAYYRRALIGYWTLNREIRYIIFSCRYVEDNVRRSAEYRLYNINLPQWLHNRPLPFTKHCIEKLTLSKEIKAEDISYVETLNDSYFHFRSVDNISGYKVFLGANEDLYPSCECQSWKRNLLPCKHLIAIFENFEEFGWHSLPIKYTTSPYFNLDNNVINTVKIEVNDIADDGSYPVCNDQPITIDLPTKKYPKRTKASSCRELLNQIKSLTYLVNDMDVLDVLEEKLKTALDYLQLNSPQEEGLFIESANIKSRVKL